MPESVLVADEVRDDADALALLLGGAGFVARAAYSADEAIALMDAWRPQSAVVSVPLQGTRGFEVARRARESCGTSLRLVAYSRWDTPADEERLRQAGFDRIVSRTAPPVHILEALSDEGRLLVMRSLNETARRQDLLLDLATSLVSLARLGVGGGESTTTLERARRIAGSVDEALRRLPLLEERARLANRLADVERRIADAEAARKPRSFF